MALPVGYHDFHSNPFFNYQLNRWYSLGFTKFEEIEEAGKRIRNQKDYIEIFINLAEKAISEKRMRNAAFYLRAAEFLIPPNDARKKEIYDRFIETFDKAFWLAGFIRHEVDFNGGKLPVMYFPAQGGPRKDTLVCFGGFDSLIEEFYSIWDHFSRNGYEVYAFEGPGQGGALRNHGLTFQHNWEVPLRALLDHFQINRCTVLGVSMGGYWAIRAAAFEKRITRVIAFPPVYDWMELASDFNKRLVNKLMPYRGLMNFLIKLKMKIPVLKHAVEQAMYISGGKKPIEAVDWMLGMNSDFLHSGLVFQKVLLLTGENDAFQPPVLLEKQKEALKHARSVQTRIFKKEEQADQHCQMGNLGLALDEILHWLNYDRLKQS
ncbi:MAG: alpha/beta hydrolase [Saprospiraceae bacterium]